MFKTESGREIEYYGQEYGDSIHRKNISDKNKINSLNELFEVLLKAWVKETAYPSCQNDPEYTEPLR